MRAAVLSALTGCCLLVAASAPQAAGSQAIDRLLDLLGYQAYVDDLEATYRRAPDDPTMSPEQRANWTKSAQDLFAAEDMMGAAQAALDALSPEEAQTLLAFYDTEFGKRVTAMEVAVQDPARASEIDDEIDAFTEVLSAMSPSRLDLLADLDATFGSTEDTVARVLNFQFGLMRGLMSANTEGPMLSDGEILAQIQLNADALRDEIAENAGRWAGYTYRSLPDADLAAYIAFLQTAPAQRLYQLTDDAVTALVVRDAFELGRIYASLETAQEL